MRRLLSRLSTVVFLAAALVGVALLVLFLAALVREGMPRLSVAFLSGFPSRDPDHAGIRAALAGSLWLIALTGAIAVPIGVGAALYLEEVARRGFLSRVIEVNIANLAGVPSIVYGILGLGVFVRGMGLGRSVLAGALTLALLALPTIIIATREALRAVPCSLREAAYALGASRWQAISAHVLPAALPGIMTGVILALSRAAGETAPLVLIGALTWVAFVPTGPLDAFTALPLQIFNWASRPQHEFMELAAAAILVLLAVLLSMNAVAVVVRHRAEASARW